MKRFVKRLAPLCAAAAFWLSAAAAHADPLTLNGIITLDQSRGAAGNFHLFTEEFDLTGILAGRCDSCGVPSLNLRGSFSSDSVNVGSGTIQGTFYPELFIVGTIELNSSQVSLASGHETDEILDGVLRRVVALNAPFIATGVLNAGLASDFLRGPGFYTAALVGTGRVAYRLAESTAFPATDSRHWEYRGATYTFNSSAAPTPEPATVLLFVSALGVVGVRYRRSSL